MYKKGWLFDNDGVQLHVGHIPGRKQPCIYMIEDSYVTILASCENDEAAEQLAVLHAKLAAGWLGEYTDNDVLQQEINHAAN